jgi:hypothetical protein
MGGYSGTPLPKKLGIREGARVVLVQAPAGFSLGELPEGAAVGTRLRDRLDVILFFTRRRDELERRFTELARRLQPAGALWIGWPKKSSGVESDLDEAAVMEIGLAEGDLVDNKFCAIDETWSGLRFVVRKERRALWRPR